MALNREEKKRIDEQIKAYQNCIKHFRDAIKALREQRKGKSLRDAQIVVGGSRGRSRIIKKLE
tara:strand:+ start:2399 stop:2587 length:189 start_codon:yes stop_codon:yes gene_type:complete